MRNANRLLALGCGLMLLGCGEPHPGATSDPSGTGGRVIPAPSGASLGVNASLDGKRLFPDDNAWNQAVDTLPVDPNSDALIDSIGRQKHLHPDYGADWNGGPFGFPYVVVSGTTARVPVSFTYADESDMGPYPIPPGSPIEGGAASSGDRHVIAVDRDAWKLYELFAAYPDGAGFKAGSGAVFDLSSNALRPAGWTSADAAGLPIFPGLVRYDEVVEQKVIRHALRFTVSRTRRAYVHPARHWASSLSDATLPPMGMRVRLKKTVEIAAYPPSARVVLQALKPYGMFVADNGSDWYLSGTADPRWNDEENNALKRLTGNDFEVVQMGSIVAP
ncbi:hypothetical protein D3C86_1064890 [compost metagenome]